ncbi:MAG: hypothetical protein DI547_16845 [Sphingobium sp.]|nr:MAG: hypothetical protein DI547_16845 [Sphingobium sp.]
MRRKGERPVEHQREPYGPGHPVAQSIATGTGWFDAWTQQYCTPWEILARRSGVPVNRIAEICFGASITRSEVEAFAPIWHSEPEDVLASLPDRSLLIEG